MASTAIDRRDLLAAGLVLVGLGLLVFGQFSVTKAGAYLFVAEEPTPEAALDDDARVVAYEDLSASMQRKFENRLRGETTYVGPESTAEDALPWGLYQVGYVAYEGAYYETGMTVANPAVSRSTVMLVGGGFLVAGLALGGWRRLDDG